MEPECLLSHSRVVSISWASWIQSITPHPTSWRSILISSSHLRLGLPSVVSFPQVSPPKPCTHISPVHATCLAHILLDLIIRTILGDEYRSLISSLCSFLQPLSPRPTKVQIFSLAHYSQTPSAYVPPSMWATIILLLLLLTAIGLLHGGSGYFTCVQNMKLVTTKFNSGGLHEKHVVANWNLGNHISICL